MGRKIPGRKHHGVRDPEKQQKVRFESIRFKVDNPPKRPDDQEIPKSALKLLKLKEQAKQPIKRKRKPKKELLSLEKFLDKDEKLPGMVRPDKFIPKIVQKPNEKPASFINRIHNISQSILNEVQFEEQYKLTVQRDPETGNVVKVEKKKPDPFDPTSKRTSKKKKLSVKKKEKKLAKLESDSNVKDFSQFKDVVEFGEIVHRPPVKLPALKNAEKIPSSKQSKTKNLLLYSLMKKDKNNKLSQIEKEKQEKEREFIVQAYRNLKNKKNMVK